VGAIEVLEHATGDAAVTIRRQQLRAAAGDGRDRGGGRGRLNGSADAEGEQQNEQREEQSWTGGVRHADDMDRTRGRKIP
jgi:hypothetical protein